ncbi:hypothetical protein [Cytobacillus oceanisediminis]|uniref:hypothetical protein n=1 Tax=Cytobacillus oceanisediminis TaxID=665099 RepID=UPI0037362351
MEVNISPVSEVKVKNKKKFQLPHVYVILFIMMALGFLATYLVPSGSFQRAETATGAKVIIPGTFEYGNNVNLTLFDFIFAIPNGMVQAGAIIFGGLMMGGLVAVLDKSGLLPLGVRKIASLLQSRTILVVPILMTPIAIFTNITGAMEMSLLYIPIIVPLVIKMGFDRFTDVRLSWSVQ